MMKLFNNAGLCGMDDVLCNNCGSSFGLKANIKTNDGQTCTDAKLDACTSDANATELHWDHECPHLDCDHPFEGSVALRS